MDKYTTSTFDLYEKGRRTLTKTDYFNKIELSHRFYEGDQWYGLNIDKNMQRPQVYNFIANVVDIKVANICVNRMGINFSGMDATDTQTSQICHYLNRHARQQWELQKLDTAMWNDVIEGFIAGNAFRYFYDEGRKSMPVDSTNIMLADEKKNDIQSQKYILIIERLDIDDVKEIARQNGIKEDDIENITCDKPDSTQDLGDQKEDVDNYVTSIMKLWKKDGIVHYCKSTRNLEYIPATSLGLTYYPIAMYNPYPKKWNARGNGGVYPLLDNQIAFNKLMVNRNNSVARTGFPTLVYNKSKIENAKDLLKVGTAIAVNDFNANDIAKIIAYLQPPVMSGDAKNMSEEIMWTTKELANAGRAMTGDINPEQASGTAIIAVRDQAMLPSTKQIQFYIQYIEDIAHILFDMWKVYNPNGFEISFVEQGMPVVARITGEQLQNLKTIIRIDVASENPFSKMAREQALDRILQMQLITFDEYVEALDDNSSAPKEKLMAILMKRQEIMQQQEQMMMDDPQQMEMLRQRQMMEQAQMQEQNPEVQKVMAQLGQIGV
jgi:hypothetical protein